ncbi:MAG: serine--tRNA ligase [Nitrospirota bacterium]
MLDLKFTRENREKVTSEIKKRGIVLDLEDLIRYDDKRKEFSKKADELKAKRNKVSDEIGKLKREGKEETSEDKREEMKGISYEIKELDERIKRCEDSIAEILLLIPNLPDASVPVGADETGNVEIKKWGEPTKFSFEPKAHWDIGEALDIIDFERAGKITGARFVLYKGAAALLERSLISFMLNLHTREHRYKEVLPPFMVNRASMTGTGQLPKFEKELFKVEGDDYFLIPTAEVPVTNIHRDEILEGDKLPIYYTAYTPCFRREAGSYGKDTRGLIRQHQFNKVELVKFARPEDSYNELESLLLNAEEVLKRLNLPYRVIVLCTGDMGFAAAKTYDIEVWLPGQNKYREISSCSNFTDFQARRANIRFRREPKAKPEYVHTLNGSGLAVGRTLVAILENYQQEDGTVIVPEALRHYMGGMERIKK